VAQETVIFSGDAMDNIRYFKPLDEPDVPVDRIGSVPVSGLPASWED